jgi:hypothetical protein
MVEAERTGFLAWAWVRGSLFVLGRTLTNEHDHEKQPRLFLLTAPSHWQRFPILDFRFWIKSKIRNPKSKILSSSG